MSLSKEMLASTVFERLRDSNRKMVFEANATFGLPIINSAGMRPGTVVRTAEAIYRPDVEWSERPQAIDRRFGEWLQGLAEMPLLWEGCD